MGRFHEALLFTFYVFVASPASAGGGPENVLLIVNSGSESSLTIANHYIQMRKIPAQNVVYLNWKGGKSAAAGKRFRSRILMPILKAIEDRHITPQIDYVIYSSDFPWRIDLQGLFPDEKLPRPFDATASITGATYLTPMIVGENSAIVAPNINWYVPGPIDPNMMVCQQLANVQSRGFRSRYLWDRNGNQTKDVNAGQRYLLSTMLGVTSGRGNTVDEVLSYLRRAVAADGKRPRGTIYFMANSDVRSKPRDKCFAGVAAQINRLGVRALEQRGTIPKGAKDVVGLTTGVKQFDWPASGSVILPGAICEHLTSYGGDFSTDAFQTPLSEFLRHGAAGASGTVKEPSPMQAKFPLPSIHLHYVRGCSLAEAFYQAVSGPYQLLIVGDPLCQPWARFPTVTLEGIKPGQEVRGSISIAPSGTAPGGQGLRAIDLFVDGRLAGRLAPGAKLNLDSSKLADGYHELRLVGIDAGTIETQGRIIVPLTVNNRGTELELTVSPLPAVGHAGSIRARVKQEGATAIAIRQNSREVGRVKGGEGAVEISAATLGRGPTTLQAFSEGDAPTISRPVQLEVK
jgi:uncharacterized protein (TIGR03790 family)